MRGMLTAGILALGMMILLPACGGDGSDTEYSSSSNSLTLSVTSFAATAEATSFSVVVTTDAEFQAYTSDSWISVSPTYSNGSATLTVSIEENTEYSSRSGTVTINASGTRSSIAITQEALETTIEGPDGYTLVWNDEFEDDALGSDWTYEVQSAGWVNNELQNYVKSTDVVYVSDGTLKIKCFDDDGTIKSGRIYAKKSSGWKYGYIEASIKLPTGKGTWPAFWMMPVNYTAWPDDGEIDIMEEVGYNANYVVSTIHCNAYNNTGTSTESASKYVSTAQSEFHTYALKWTESKMDFLVDGSTILTYVNEGTGTDQWPFSAAFYVILNLAWGGSWGGAYGVDESCLPAIMEVDYVRVFQEE